MTLKRRFAGILVACTVALSFAGGGLVHAFIPHDHDNETIWTELHAALRHEDKKAVPDIVPAWFIATLASIGILVRMPTVLCELIPLRDLEVVRRGIVKYRRFG
jgi:hypothetical protein